MDFLTNKYIVYLIVLLLILYSACLRPNLPKFVRKIFNNPVVRLIVLALILASNFKPEISVTLAMAFFITINCITEQEITEAFGSRVCLTMNGNQNCQTITDNNIQIGVNIISETEEKNSSNTTGLNSLISSIVTSITGKPSTAQTAPAPATAMAAPAPATAMATPAPAPTMAAPTPAVTPTPPALAVTPAPATAMAAPTGTTAPTMESSTPTMAAPSGTTAPTMESSTPTMAAPTTSTTN
jgi:hypothetical protein